MLPVVAIQQGNPVTGVIALEPCNPALHDDDRTKASENDTK